MSLLVFQMKYRNKACLYERDVLVLKKYSESKYKLTLHNILRRKGFECEDFKYSQKGSVNDEKLENNIIRARNKIFDYAFCNHWDYFVNLTLNKNKYNRYDLKKYIKDLSQWLRNYSKKHDIKLAYLFIPEQHKDGAWHIHGFIRGIPDEDITDFVVGVHPQKLIDAGYKNWIPYFNKFGFVSLGKIRNAEACSKYVTKYVTKDMADNNRELGNHLYYCSQGLKTPLEIERGLSNGQFDNPDYENEYVKVKWLQDISQSSAYFNYSQ